MYMFTEYNDYTFVPIEGKQEVPVTGVAYAEMILIERSWNFTECCFFNNRVTLIDWEFSNWTDRSKWVAE